MLSKIHWLSFAFGIVFVMFIWPLISSFLAKRGSANTQRTA